MSSLQGLLIVFVFLLSVLLRTSSSSCTSPLYFTAFHFQEGAALIRWKSPVCQEMVTGYELQYVEGCGLSPTESFLTNNTHVELQQLNSNTVYFFRIRAILKGNSQYSACLKASTDTTEGTVLNQVVGEMQPHICVPLTCSNTFMCISDSYTSDCDSPGRLSEARPDVYSPEDCALENVESSSCICIQDLTNGLTITTFCDRYASCSPDQQPLCTSGIEVRIYSSFRVSNQEKINEYLLSSTEVIKSSSSFVYNNTETSYHTTRTVMVHSTSTSLITSLLPSQVTMYADDKEMESPQILLIATVSTGCSVMVIGTIMTITFFVLVYSRLTKKSKQDEPDHGYSEVAMANSDGRRNTDPDPVYEEVLQLQGNAAYAAPRHMPEIRGSVSGASENINPEQDVCMQSCTAYGKRTQ